MRLGSGCGDAPGKWLQYAPWEAAAVMRLGSSCGEFGKQLRRSGKICGMGGREMAGERAGKRKRRTAAVLAGILWASVPAAGSNALGAEIGPGVELERRLQGEVSGGGSGRAGMDPAEIDQAGIELFREAQRRQRELADAASDIDGGWSLEYGGLRIYRPIAGTAEFEGLGTEQMRGVVSLASGGEIVFEDGQVRVSRGGEERLRELSPEEWSALSDDFMNGTTYDLDMVTRLWVAGREAERADGSTVLAYELDGEAAAERMESVVADALAGAGISVPEESGWLRLDRVEGELTVSREGYMQVDRLEADASILLGQSQAKAAFEICVSYR